MKGKVTMTPVSLPTETAADDVEGPEQGYWTSQDYTDLPQDGLLYEIMNGVLLRFAPLEKLYREALDKLSYYLTLHIRTARLGHTYTSPRSLALAPDIVVQPDFFVILHRDNEIIPEAYITVAPDLVVEVSSPRDARYHWREKYDAYAQAGVREYWIVHPETASIDVLALEDGSYRSLGFFEGRAKLRSQVLPWFSLSVEKFFARQSAASSAGCAIPTLQMQALPPSIPLENSGNTPLPFLPPRYSDSRVVSAAPMGSAPLRYTPEGQVAWDKTWEDFCEVALAGGPPHRGTLLEPVSPDDVAAHPEDYERVVAEIERGLQLVTGLSTARCPTPGWVGLVCSNETMALWLLRAIAAENVCIRREGNTLYLPAGPAFRLESEIKNVITAAAKTHHYWTELCSVLYDR